MDTNNLDCTQNHIEKSKEIMYMKNLIVLVNVQIFFTELHWSDQKTDNNQCPL